MNQPVQRPFQMTPGMARMNQTAAGCGFWLAVLVAVLFFGGIALAVALVALA